MIASASNLMKFEASSPSTQSKTQSGGNEFGAFRGEKHEPRVARLTRLFAVWQFLTYLGVLSLDCAKAFASGQPVELPDGSTITKNSPRNFNCAGCADYHGKQRKGESETDTVGLQHNIMFSTPTGKIVVFSLSCLDHYLADKVDQSGRLGAMIAAKQGKGDVRQAIKGLDLFATHFPQTALAALYSRTIEAEKNAQTAKHAVAHLQVGAKK
jgi:hypothetical protein